MDKKIIVLVAFVLFGFLFWFFSPGKYDELAECMTEKGVKVYGAYWCPNCKKQAELFGKSYNKIEYIECAIPNNGAQNEFCQKEGIKAYPTWELENGERVVGVKTPEELAQLTSCPV